MVLLLQRHHGGDAAHVPNAVSIAIVSSGAGTSLLRRYSGGYKPAATIVRLWDGSAALHGDLNAT